MWDHRYLLRMDWRFLIVIMMLMFVSLLTIASMTQPQGATGIFFTFYVKQQIKWFAAGWVVFLFFAGLDYRKLARWAWSLYILMIVLLLGLFLARPIHSVHRWYSLPFIGMNIQPSEYAKLILVLMLSLFLQKKEREVGSSLTAMQVLLLAGFPFFLIVKQPDLGTALILYPITLMMCYIGGIHRKVVRWMTGIAIVSLLFVSLFFMGVLSHEKLEPVFMKVLKNYQYQRLNANTYHQQAAQTAIAIGGISGTGWCKSEFSGKKWLPAAHTDSIFAAFGEEFGLIGIVCLLFLFYALIYLAFHVARVAKDRFGQLFSTGIAVYLSMHIIVNIAMMCGFLPISGVPLLLMSYGGSSVLATMIAAGILQGIYTRRFMFL